MYIALQLRISVALHNNKTHQICQHLLSLLLQSVFFNPLPCPLPNFTELALTKIISMLLDPMANSVFNLTLIYQPYLILSKSHLPLKHSPLGIQTSILSWFSSEPLASPHSWLLDPPLETTESPLYWSSDSSVNSSSRGGMTAPVRLMYPTVLLHLHFDD